MKSVSKNSLLLHLKRFHCVALLLLLLPPNLRSADPFAEIIRSTLPRTTEEEVKSFHLPPGFEIQLFAAEPDIAKPMNMAFDERGRLWITQSREYPFPAKPGTTGRDAIKILEDTDGDGRADKITTFVEGLNIPIGLYPYKSGVIAFSIPNIYYFQDTDGDGKADKQEILYGPIGFEKDTHGMTSAFRRGFDGWIYACHGFNNITTLKGQDGSSITMQSGNTYRMKPDGSRVEHFTHGQVNPFGLMFDPLGNLYSADCHSSPIYQLLRGGYYPSFGKPDDGLGFAPTMMNHSHGSTAIGGIVYYAAGNFPNEFRNNIFVGNVMTCRINRDSLEEHGSTRLAKEKPDFLSSDDPWFRPVDLQLGPDGALYVADFYNRIIGHYEVPLDHPGRDRERGRIWRIFYSGKTKATAGNTLAGRGAGKSLMDFSRLTAEQLFLEMGAGNLTLRMLAMNELIDRIGPAAIAPVKKSMARTINPAEKQHGLWVLHRLGGLDELTLATAAKDADRGVRVHALRVLSETDAAHFSESNRQLAVQGLKDNDAFVQRAAADALGQHPKYENIQPLLELRQRVLAEDTHLLYAVRLALRNQLVPAGNLTRLLALNLSPADARVLADMALGVTNGEAGPFLLKHIQHSTENRESLTRYLRHAVQYISPEQVDEVATFTRARFADDADFQLAMFKSVQEGTAQRGAKLSAGAQSWGGELAEKLLASAQEETNTWSNTPVEGMADTKNPWFVQKRASADGDKAASFLCSLPPGGEQLTGVLRSRTFTVPESLSFYLAGHDGFPEKAAQKKNVVRLLDAKTRAVLAEKFPPRNDLAQLVKWDLKAHAGQPAYIEVTDADNGTAYAWLAIGRFEPPVVSVPAMNPSQVAQRQQAAADLARTLPLPKLEPSLARLLVHSSTELETRAAAARALLAFHPNEQLASLVPILSDAGMAAPLREKICQAVADKNSSVSSSVLLEAIRALPRRLQVKLAQTLVSSATGAESLLQMVAAGQAPPALLRERSVKEKLFAAKPDNAAARVEQLTKGLSPANEELQKVIDKRRAGFNAAKSSAAKGDQLFTQNCRVCHQLDGQGGLVGPQLDGVGNRGLERLCEDVIDPNRSVDLAFRTTLLTLKDGDVVSGLFRREEGEMVVLAESTGKEISFAKTKIMERKQSESSLMPDNFGELLSSEDFNHLMAYLLSKGSKPSPAK